MVYNWGMDIYREIVLDHYTHPRHQGILPSATHRGKEYNPLCGDEVEFFLQIDGHQVKGVSHQTHGCAIALATASLLGEAALDQTAADIVQWSLTEILEKLGTPLTATRQQCAAVALKALQQAISQPIT